MLQDRLDSIKEYFQSIELMEGKWVICVKYKPKWGAYPSEDGRIQAIPDETAPDVYWYYSKDASIDVDSIINLIEETIQTNLDAIKKAELFKLKALELKKLFSDENISFKRLQTLTFVISDEEEIAKSTKTSTKKSTKKKISSKKEILKMTDEDLSVPEQSLSENSQKNDKNDVKTSKTTKKSAENVETTAIVNATDLSQAEIDDLRG